MAHWRDSARSARFFIIDYRAAFPLLLFLLHIRFWTFFLAVGVVICLYALEWYGFTVPIFFRLFRAWLAGPHKQSQPWWRK
ncbi:MAG: IcmT/TraK family protein [Gammaproteobacteria bacterium]